MSIGTQIEKINLSSTSYAAKTTVVGQPDIPGLSAAEMQKSVEYMPRNLLTPKINELVEAVNGSYSKAETDSAINEKISEIGAGDMAQAVYDSDGSVKNAGGISDYVEDYVDDATSGTKTNVENMKFVPVSLSAEPGAEWSSSVPSTQTVSVSGMTADWVPGIPTLDVDKYQAIGGGHASTDYLKAMMEQMNKISMITSSKDELTFTCFDEKPADYGLYLRVPGMVGRG